MNRPIRPVAIAAWAALYAAAGCAPAPAPAPAGTGTPSVEPAIVEVAVSAAGETAAPAAGGANDAAALLLDGTGLLLAAEETGIGIFALSGERLGAYDGIAATHVEAIDGFPLAGRSVALVLASDQADGSLHAFTVGADGGLIPAGVEPVPTDAEVTGLCLYPSPVSGNLYAFSVAEAGVVRQWEVYDGGGKVGLRMIRLLHTGFGAGHCVVDATAGQLYVAEEGVGIWRIDAEPETDGERTAVDLTVPFGTLGGETKGLAIHPDGYLLASDTPESAINVYELESGRRVGRFKVEAAGSVDALEEAEGLHFVPGLSAERFPAGVLVAADDDNDDEVTNYKLISWQDVATALRLAPGPVRKMEQRVPVVNVMAAVETEPVHDFGDAADDPAIWVDREAPERSVIIGAQKQRGLYVYDLAGRTLQLVEDGHMNNVDLRYDFPLAGARVDLVAASNRSNGAITVYAFDRQARRLGSRLADIPTGMQDPYGLCMYRSARTGDYFVYVNDTEGNVQQWQLTDNGNGRLAYAQVRTFRVESQPEGCVADDENGILYLGEEAVGVWRLPAEPDADAALTLVDSVENGHLVADVEGIGLYQGPDGSGYLVVSCQGDNTYAVYRRDAGNAFVGRFRVIANAALGVDGISETDGLEVSSAPLGPDYPAGIFVAQDGRNVMPPERQNFKIVGWAAITGALGLTPP